MLQISVQVDGAFVTKMAESGYFYGRVKSKTINFVALGLVIKDTMCSLHRARKTNRQEAD